MKDLQKIGGLAALIHAAAYLVGIVIAVTLIVPVINSGPDQYLAFLVDNQPLLYIWILIVYLVAGFCLVAVSLALYDRLKIGSPAVTQIATVLGLIWACLIIGSGNLMLHGFIKLADLYVQDPVQTTTVRVTLEIVENGIISANELTGGLWILLLSWSALKAREFNKVMNYLGVVIGVAGLLTLLPALTDIVQTIFAIGMIVWFAWVGIIMLRNNTTLAT